MTATQQLHQDLHQAPGAWLDILEPRLVDKTKIPYADSPDTFSMEEMANRLGNLFQIAGGKITLGNAQKMDPTFSFSETHLLSYGYQIGLTSELLYWLIDRKEAERLIALLLQDKQELMPDLDADLIDAFMRYFSLESLLHLRALGFQDDLLVQCMGKALPPSNEMAYVRMMLSWDLHGTLFTSTLLLPESLVEQWNRHFQKKHHAEPLSEAQAERISLLIHLDVGTITLTYPDWEQTQIGDFLLMDHCTLIPGRDKGRIRLTASNIPLFRAMVKEGAIKLLDYSLYQEVEPAMSKKFSPDDASFGEEADDSLDHEDEASEEEEESELEEDEEEEEDLDETEEDLEDESEEADLEEDLEEEELEADSDQALPALGAHETLSHEKETLTPIEQVPFTMTVEVGRIHMSLSKLRKLEPGQTLDLSIHAEDGVDLVVEGQTIGRGELLRLGENIGVRVTELG